MRPMTISHLLSETEAHSSNLQPAASVAAGEISAATLFQTSQLITGLTGLGGNDLQPHLIQVQVVRRPLEVQAAGDGVGPQRLDHLDAIGFVHPALPFSSFSARQHLTVFHNNCRCTTYPQLTRQFQMLHDRILTGFIFNFTT